MVTKQGFLINRNQTALGELFTNQWESFLLDHNILAPCTSSLTLCLAQDQVMLGVRSSNVTWHSCKKLRALINNPSVISTTTLRELGGLAKKKQKVDIEDFWSSHS